MTYAQPRLMRRQLRRQYPRKASDALRIAADRLKGHFVQGTFERRIGDKAEILGPDESLVCMLGAINWAMTGHAGYGPAPKKNNVRREVYEQTLECAQAALPTGYSEIATYNDIPGRTERQARAVLLKAAKLCEHEGH